MNAPIDRAATFAAIHAELREKRGWLLWKLEHGRKVPYYASGRKRHGTQGSAEDRAALVSYEQALAASSDYAGLGFIQIDAGRIGAVNRACELGRAWFERAELSQPPQVHGRPASEDEALSTIATLLKSAATPLVYLAPELSCDAQREAVALADVLGAAIDSVSSLPRPLAGLLAAQEQGEVDPDELGEAFLAAKQGMD